MKLDVNSFDRFLEGRACEQAFRIANDARRFRREFDVEPRQAMEQHGPGSIDKIVIKTEEPATHGHHARTGREVLGQHFAF